MKKSHSFSVFALILKWPLQSYLCGIHTLNCEFYENVWLWNGPEHHVAMPLEYWIISPFVPFFSSLPLFFFHSCYLILTATKAEQSKFWGHWRSCLLVSFKTLELIEMLFTPYITTCRYRPKGDNYGNATYFYFYYY